MARCCFAKPHSENFLHLFKIYWRSDKKTAKLTAIPVIAKLGLQMLYAIKWFLNVTNTLCLCSIVAVAVCTLHTHKWRRQSTLILVLPESFTFTLQLNCSGTECIAQLENLGCAICVLHEHVFLSEKYCWQIAWSHKKLRLEDQGSRDYAGYTLALRWSSYASIVYLAPRHSHRNSPGSPYASLSHDIAFLST